MRDWGRRGGARGRGTSVVPLPVVMGLLVVAGVYCVELLKNSGTDVGQGISNFGLCAGALVAGAAALYRRSRHTVPTDRRFWLLLGGAMLCWSAGQAVWALYETVLRQDVPFPSPADVGYLGLPPLATAALLGLPLAAQSWAGRGRTFLDGMMVAAALFLCSWIIVLGPVFHAGADSLLSQVISLAYPVWDVILITIVTYTWLRSRHLNRTLPVSLPVVGTGLVFFAVGDSGFTYETTAGTYSSGNVIDLGWFAGFVILTLAALKPMPAQDAPPAGDELVTRQLGNLMPYAAVVLALLTSSIEVLRNGHGDLMISWVRTSIMVLLVLRQVLALRENHVLTRTLEDRVRRRTVELEQSRERFASMVQHSSDVVTVVDAGGTVHYQSASSQRVLGFAPEQLETRSVYHLVPDDTERALLATALEHAAAEDMRLHTLSSTWRHADGHLCRMEVTVTNLLGNPHVAGLVLNSRDVTDRVALEEQLTGMAFTDSLTELANRALFKDRLQHALGRSDPRDGAVAVLFLDLDGFKSVNDMIGHSAGDALLVQVADRLRDVCAPGDTVARFGGDEFAVLLEDQVDDVYQTGLAGRIGTVIREPFLLQGERVHVTTSVGIARHDEHATTAEQLLRNADLAMYQAKAAGHGGYAVFEPAMHAGLVERVRLEGDLRQAVENHEFVVHYQPMVSMRTGAITGSEALVRWQHPTRGLLAPGEFIAVAESTGLIRAIGDFVLREACAQTIRWEQAGGVALRISVNVSPRQLLDSDYVDQVRAALADTGLAPERLTLEMTESVLIDDRSETLDALTALHDFGIRLAIDDFGTGYSSLSYLHRFPVDVLKIDRSFVERLGGGDDGGDGTLVSTILHLGQSLQLETVAEGIERPQEMLILRRQGCTTGQGFHFSPPVAPEVVGEMLRDQATSAPVA
jgi:diguanylate cyclase (GGDEF)-like protein/PAS domain S-box-containing protein